MSMRVCVFAVFVCVLSGAYAEEEPAIRTSFLDNSNEEWDPELLKINWWYMEDGKQIGPVMFDHLKMLFFKQNITMYTMVWCGSFSDWRELKTVPGVRIGLSDGRGYRERLQLFAIDENKFVEEAKKAEQQLSTGGFDDDGSQMFCGRTGAVGEVLRRAVVKRLLKDVMKDLRESEKEKMKILKAIRATKFQIAHFQKNNNQTLEEAQREAVLLSNKAKVYFNKIQELRIQEYNMTLPEIWTGVLIDSRDLLFEIIEDPTQRLVLGGVVLFLLLGLYTCCFKPAPAPRPRSKTQKPKDTTSATSDGNAAASSEGDAGSSSAASKKKKKA